MQNSFVLKGKFTFRCILAGLMVLFSSISLAEEPSAEAASESSSAPSSEQASGQTGAAQSLLRDFANRYAMAWSSQDPQLLASFYTEDGVLQVNGGTPAVGRAAIAEKAAGFMEAFPDMVVQLEALDVEDGRVVFRWLWTGTNTGPGGTGNAVRLRGHESWAFGGGGLIQESLGHYDEAEYQRQVSGAAAEP